MVDVVNKVNGFFEEAISKGASDIHWEPGKEEYTVRFRLDGDLRRIASGPMAEFPVLVSRLKILSNLNITEKRRPQDGGFSFEASGNLVDIRTSSAGTIYGEKVVCRLLNPEESLKSISNLGILEEDESFLEDLTSERNAKRSGMILFTGPTGCGKTTSLYALLDRENREEVNIMTIEDPVEYRLDGIYQIEINEKANITFNNTLRSLLRQDPDILLIGEIRDEDTAKISTQAAITGHKVYGTLHTVDTYSAVFRLLQMGIEDYLIKASLDTIISQRLVKRLCSCKKKRPVTPEEEYIFDSFHLKVNEIYSPRGCEDCYKGYRGRLAVMEILKREDLTEEILDQTDLSSMRKIGSKKGIPTLFEKALFSVLNGETSMEEALKCQSQLGDF